jgi:ADP-ribose pyrophosphatase YjhB (NUDIX family)
VEPCLGQWSLPGGFVELGESTEEAIARELREETTLTALKVRLLGVSTHASRFHGAVTVIGYAIEEWEGVPQAGSDTLDLRFYSRDEMPELPFKAHREILALYDASSR